MRDVQLIVDAMRDHGINARVVVQRPRRPPRGLKHARRAELLSRNVACSARTETPVPLRPRQPVVSLLLTLGVHPRTVMEIVGHSAMEMTMNVYGHVSLDTQRAALDRLGDELSR